MPRAKSDLTELVASRSVADPKQFSPEERANAAQCGIDAFSLARARRGRLDWSKHYY
jgi:hypothetical protein